MVSVARGVVGLAPDGVTALEAARRCSVEFDASEGQQISVEIFGAVEHEAVAGAGPRGVVGVTKASMPPSAGTT